MCNHFNIHIIITHTPYCTIVYVMYSASVCVICFTMAKASFCSPRRSWAERVWLERAGLRARNSSEE